MQWLEPLQRGDAASPGRGGHHVCAGQPRPGGGDPVDAGGDAGAGSGSGTAERGLLGI